MVSLTEKSSTSIIRIPGYPTFAFRYDDEKKQYAIMNVETQETTDFFVDEILYSEVPLENWTANYVVIRIGNDYYLSDNNGTCHFREKTPFFICRNGFVFLSANTHSNYFINQQLQVCSHYVALALRSVNGYDFAVAQCENEDDDDDDNDYDDDDDDYNDDYDSDDEWWLLTSDGKKKFLSNTKYTGYTWNEDEEGYDKIDFWYTIDEAGISFISKDFTKVYDTNCSPEQLALVGKHSQTYILKDTEKYYSVYFDDAIQAFYSIANGEFAVFQNQGYFFDAKGNITTIEGDISLPMRLSEEQLIYRKGLTVVIHNLKENTTQETKITPEQAYQMMLMEKMIRKESA